MERLTSYRRKHHTPNRLSTPMLECILEHEQRKNGRWVYVQRDWPYPGVIKALITRKLISQTAYHPRGRVLLSRGVGDSVYSVFTGRRKHSFRGKGSIRSDNEHR